MIKQILTMGIVIFIMVMLFMYVFQRHLIYFPDRHRPNPKEFNAQNMQIVSLKTNDGILLESWYKPAKKNQPTILYFHGNAKHIGYRSFFAQQFIKAGFGVFLLEYRGYGGNKGSPSEQGFYEDARTALTFLHNQGIRSKDIAVYGESLGTGVATYIAAKNPVCALILQSPFSSLTEIARYHYPWVFLTPWDKYDSLSRIKSIHAPILVIHGDQDRLIPYSNGLSLYNAANHPKELLTLKGKDHNTLWPKGHYDPKLFEFIHHYCK